MHKALEMAGSAIIQNVRLPFLCARSELKRCCDRQVAGALLSPDEPPSIRSSRVRKATNVIGLLTVVNLMEVFAALRLFWLGKRRSDSTEVVAADEAAPLLAEDPVQHSSARRGSSHGRQIAGSVRWRGRLGLTLSVAVVAASWVSFGWSIAHRGTE